MKVSPRRLHPPFCISLRSHDWAISPSRPRTPKTIVGGSLQGQTIGVLRVQRPPGISPSPPLFPPGNRDQVADFADRPRATAPLRHVNGRLQYLGDGVGDG
jgi:hypothetical protein